jgi:hypothetical protein
MGVTYWQLGQRAKALELTRSGADQIEKAVEGGVLDQDALAVPYGNLATMHKELGNNEEGTRYAHLAQNARAAASVDDSPMATQPRRTATGPMSPAGNAMRRNMANSPRSMAQASQQPTTNATANNAQPLQRRNVAQRQPSRTGQTQQAPPQANSLNIHPELRGN